MTSGSIHLGLMALLFLLARSPVSDSIVAEITLIERPGARAQSAVVPRALRPKSLSKLPKIEIVKAIPTVSDSTGPQVAELAPAVAPAVDAGGAFVSYENEVAYLLNTQKKYPESARRMRQQGRVKIRFKINRDGRLLSYEIIEPSAYSSLNAATQSLLQAIGSFKPFPDQTKATTWVFTVPIEYKL